MLITPEYKELNAKLHRDRPEYGMRSLDFADQVLDLAEVVNVKTLLDYGAGKGRLAEALKGKVTVFNYDPAIEKFAHEPDPNAFVVSIDVLEHIEPECLDAVLNHMWSLTRETVFLTVATCPAIKTLADGRNAHLIVEPVEWWLPKLWRRWEMHTFFKSGHGFLYMGHPHDRIALSNGEIA